MLSGRRNYAFLAAFGPDKRILAAQTYSGRIKLYQAASAFSLSCS